MFTKNKIRQVKIGLAVSIAILVAISYIVFSIRDLNFKAFQNANHSAEVMVKIEEISAKLNQLESAQLGYILTKNISFLEQYNKNHFMLSESLRDLKKLVSSNKTQYSNFIKLQDLVTDRINLLKRSINKSKPNTAGLLMGKLVMHSAMTKLDVMKEVERVQMNKRLSESARWSDRSTYAIIASLLIAMTLVIIESIILNREYSIKVETEKKLRLYQNQLKEKLEKLDVTNKELEQFAYVASHDLQEPLRKITTFNERINQKLADDISPDLKDYLERISNAANRMRVLIEDLLMYSRISKTDIQKVSVNLEQVLGIIKDNLEVAIQSRNVSFIHPAPLPEIIGDKTQMTQLFQNLIGNAIKFTPEDVAPVIGITTKKVKADLLRNEVTPPRYKYYQEISITDKGIGFDEKDAEKIFIVFQRLNGRSEYKGTGIGLSICKKIIENHEGYIKVKSTPGTGSTFSVFLPVVERSQKK